MALTTIQIKPNFKRLIEMKKKYNLALLPISKSDDFIYISGKFANIADQYLLGENSLPHITLYQFEMEESKINLIWEKISNTWNNEDINIELSEFSYITFNKKIYWISLLPTNPDILHKMHGFIANIIGLPCYKNYDPHLTLINTKINNYQNEIDIRSSFFHPITDTFSLALGNSDTVGQFTKIIHQKK